MARPTFDIMILFSGNNVSSSEVSFGVNADDVLSCGLKRGEDGSKCWKSIHSANLSIYRGHITNIGCPFGIHGRAQRVEEEIHPPASTSQDKLLYVGEK